MSGFSGSDTGATGSGESDFVVAGPSVPEAKKGGNWARCAWQQISFRMSPWCAKPMQL